MKESGNPEVMALLLRMVKENSGVEVQEQDADASFFELGLDSLFLTQFSVSLAGRFGVKLTFRQLSAQYGTMRKLSVFLSEAASADAAAASPAAAPAPVPATGALPASIAAPPAMARPAIAVGHRDPMIQLFLGQLEVMQRQLDALTGTAGTARSATPTAASPVASPAASAVASTTVSTATSAAAPAAATAVVEGKSASASVLDASRPPAPGARLGRDPSGQPAWFIPRADQPGKYVKLV